jgi:N-acetylneuraminic acid mutarotase
VLPGGKVLVAGGFGKDNTFLNSVELYDQATGKWTPTANLRVPRVEHTAILLSTGKVLVSGGRSEPFQTIGNSELYDPVTGEWEITGLLAQARSSHSATLLPSGLVLVAGGSDDGDTPDRLDSAELYDPDSGAWSATGHLTINGGRTSHTSTLLGNGMVLIVGGNTFGPFMAEGAELYDPHKGVWITTGAPGTVRVDHTATLLPNGKVLIVGGRKSNSTADELQSAEIYDPLMRTFAATGGLSTARNGHSPRFSQMAGC